MAKKTGHKGGSGPTKASGHIDSIMGRQYPAGMSIRGKGVGYGTASKGKRARQMAAFPSGIPGMVGGAMPGASPQSGPPPTVPGITQPQIPPPASLMQAIQRKPQSSTALVRQAILMLENAADMDNRMEPRISAAIKLLRGPAKPNSAV